MRATPLVTTVSTRLRATYKASLISACTESNPICPKHPTKAGRENVPTVQGEGLQLPTGASTGTVVARTSPRRLPESPKTPVRMRMNISPADSPKSPTHARVNSASTDPLSTLFATPGYRQNAQVKTLEMIIAERSRATAVVPNAAVPSHPVDTDRLAEGEYPSS